jgi:hypothetical protein
MWGLLFWGPLLTLFPILTLRNLFKASYYFLMVSEGSPHPVFECDHPCCLQPDEEAGGKKGRGGKEEVGAVDRYSHTDLILLPKSLGFKRRCTQSKSSLHFEITTELSLPFKDAPTQL